jgi:hypothetical protein
VSPRVPEVLQRYGLAASGVGAHELEGVA